MKKQWIVSTTLFMLMTSSAWADGEPPAENILEDQFKKRYHGILKFDAIALKNPDAKGNRVTWSAEGNVSSSDGLYTWVGRLVDYRLLGQTWTKDRPVKFSAVLAGEGTPTSDWSVNFYSFRAAVSDRGRVVDNVKTNNKYLIMNSEDFNYRSSQPKSALDAQKNSIPTLEEEAKALDKQMVATQKAADVCWREGTNGKQMTREDASRKIHQQRNEFNKQDDSEAFAVKYDREAYQPVAAACHKRSEECYEVPIQQKRNFDVNEQRR